MQELVAPVTGNQTSLSYAEWLQSGRLAAYVRDRTLHDGVVGIFDCVQPPGDMSDPACESVVIVQTWSGNLRQRSNLGGGRFSACSGPGELFVVPPDFATDIQVHVPHVIRIFAIPGDFARSAMADAGRGADRLDFGRLHAGPFASAPLTALLGSLHAPGQSDGSNARMLAESRTMMALAELARLADQPPKPRRGGLAAWAERRCHEYLDARLAEDVSLAELAAIANLSPFHFARMFKQSTGLPPHAYHRRMRAERACDLLRTTPLPVSEVAEAVGYQTPQAFARMFRAEIGSSPSAWRQAVRG